MMKSITQALWKFRRKIIFAYRCAKKKTGRGSLGAPRRAAA